MKKDKKMKKFSKWFEIYNIDHLSVYKTLMETGAWPKGFIPDGVEMDTNWQTLVAFRMACAWVDLGMAGDILWEP